jgi:hypothetical protein
VVEVSSAARWSGLRRCWDYFDGLALDRAYSIGDAERRLTAAMAGNGAAGRMRLSSRRRRAGPRSAVSVKIANSGLTLSKLCASRVELAGGFDEAVTVSCCG